MEESIDTLCSHIKSIKYENYDTVDNFINELKKYEEIIKNIEKQLKLNDLEDYYKQKDITELFNELDNINIHNLTFDELRKIRIITNIITEKLNITQTIEHI